MSIQPTKVDERNGIAEIENAILENSRTVESLRTQESAATAGPQGLAGRAAAIGGPDQRAGVYGDLALEAVGLGALNEGVKAFSSICGGEKSFRGVQTMDSLAKANRGKTGRIVTDSLSDSAALPGRTRLAGAFNTDPGTVGKSKGVEDAGKKLAKHSRDIRMVCLASLAAAHQAQHVKGYEYGLAAPGMGQARAASLTLNGYQPKGPTGALASETKAAEDSAWT